MTYRLKDNRGGTVTKNININVVSSAGEVQNITVTGGTATVDFPGIPGDTYLIQRSLDNMATWQTVLTTNVPANGLFEYVDTFGGSPPPSAYYRLSEP